MCILMMYTFLADEANQTADVNGQPNTSAFRDTETRAVEPNSARQAAHQLDWFIVYLYREWF